MHNENRMNNLKDLNAFNRNVYFLICTKIKKNSFEVNLNRFFLLMSSKKKTYKAAFHVAILSVCVHNIFYCGYMHLSFKTANCSKQRNSKMKENRS